MIYEDHDLQRGDHDGSAANSRPPVWGGISDPLPPSQSAQTPLAQGGATLTVYAHVQQLQRDLRELGFLMIANPSGVFDRFTEWAVREFQAYARMPQVARLSRSLLRALTGNPGAGEAAPEVVALGQVANHAPPVSYYVATLEECVNSARYSGPVCGVVDQATRMAIEHWLAQGYRCPVVIEAWNVAQGIRTTLFNDGSNLWRYDLLPSTVPRIYFRDFSGYYSYPATRKASDYHVLGTNLSFPGHGGPASGVPRHTWSEAEMLPELLIGPTRNIAQLAANPDGAQASTYRVVRAVAEMECMGAFDSVNAYDDAIASLGPCHWTMGVMPAGGYDDGELPAFLAYVMANNADAYNKAFGNFGLYPSDYWIAPNAGPLWNPGQRKYSGWVRLHNKMTNPALVPPNLAQMTLLDRAQDEAEYLKTWHWFFRYVMAGRTVAGVRNAMWDMVRIRIRDIRSRAVSVTLGPVVINATLGEIFTSEKSIGILLRWHIYRPVHVAGNRVITAIAKAMQSNAALNWSLPVSQWTDGHETALTDSILSEANTVNAQHAEVATWPAYAGRAGRGYVLNYELGALRGGRGSFSFDSGGI